MLKISDYTQTELLEYLNEAIEFSKGKSAKIKESLFVANLFFEDSTRTKTSFHMAEQLLGLHIIPFDSQNSSAKKGESLYDTVKTMEAIGVQLAVIRSHQDEYFDDLKNINIPIINAGDGKGNHPSQCLLDLLTIYQEFGTLEGLKIGIVGDVAHSRVARSNAEALKLMKSDVYFSGPNMFFDDEILAETPYLEWDEMIPEMDVIMLLRIQHERHDSTMSLSKDFYLKNHGLTKEREQKMKSKAIIMHPAPINRDVEIENDLVECSRSRIFRQMKNGVYARMAIIKKCLEKQGYLFNETKANL